MQRVQMAGGAKARPMIFQRPAHQTGSNTCKLIGGLPQLRGFVATGMLRTMVSALDLVGFFVTHPNP